MKTTEKAQKGLKMVKSSRGSVSVGGNPKLDDKPKAKYKPTVKETKNIKDATQMKNMRPTGPSSGRVKPTMGSAKNGKSFPDLNKDGKVTKADILKGRGVIAKSGKSMKKCRQGCK